MKVTVDIDLEDIINESRYNEISFKDEFTETLKYAIVEELKEQCKDAVVKQISEGVKKKVEEAVHEISKDILESNFKTFKFKFKDGYRQEREATIEELIISKMDDYTKGSIMKNLDEKAKSLVEDLKRRYDLAFASLIVDNMRKQNLLADDRLAELLSPKQ